VGLAANHAAEGAAGAVINRVSKLREKSTWRRALGSICPL
jgi:hypothetical protein